MVDAIRVTEQSLGQATFEPGESESRSRVFRRSLFVVADMAANEVFTAANVRSIRPAHGLPPKHLPEVLGRRAASRSAGGPRCLGSSSRKERVEGHVQIAGHSV